MKDVLVTAMEEWMTEMPSHLNLHLDRDPYSVHTTCVGTALMIIIMLDMRSSSLPCPNPWVGTDRKLEPILSRSEVRVQTLEEQAVSNQVIFGKLADRVSRLK